MLMKYFAKSFEKLCGVVAIIVSILFIGLGASLGVYLAKYIGYNDGSMFALITIGITLLSAFIAYIFNVLVFGFFAQIVEIKNELKKLNDK